MKMYVSKHNIVNELVVTVPMVCMRVILTWMVRESSSSMERGTVAPWARQFTPGIGTVLF